MNAPKPSIKDRLGKREPITEKSNIRSGVIKLNSGRLRDIQEPFQDVRTSRIGRITDYGREKDIMMVPKIVVRNRLEDFDPEYENSQGSTRSKHSYDDYDSNSDYSNESDSDDNSISKLTKRKKKLKKLLESEGSDYDDIELLKREKRKIKKLLKRKKERKEEKAKRRKERRRRERKEREYSEEEEEAEEEEERNKRRIKIQGRLGKLNSHWFSRGCIRKSILLKIYHVCKEKTWFVRRKHEALQLKFSQYSILHLASLVFDIN